MKKRNLLVALLMLICISEISTAQITFQKAYGGLSTWNDFGRSVLQDTINGGYTVAGFSNSFGSGVGIYLFHTNETGTVLWSKQYGSDAYGEAVALTSDGGYIIAGLTLSGSGFQFFAVRTDNNGDTLWTKTYNNGTSPGAASDGPMSVCQTADGGFVFTGYYDANNCFGMIRTDANGNVLWTKAYGGGGEHSRSLQQTADGGFIICGYTFNYGAGDYDAYLVKTDDAGNIIWTKTYGTTGVEEANSVQQTDDGGYIITGKTQPGGILSQGYVFLIKTDASGDTLWTKTFGGTVGEMAYSVQQTNDNGYIITGVTYSFGAGGQDVYLIRTDVAGDTLWTKAFGGVNDEFGMAVRQTTDGGFIITGETSSFGNGGIDVYLICTDANGYSGCNESKTTTIVGTLPFSIGSGGSVLSSGTTAYNDSTDITFPVKTEVPLCIFVGMPQVSGYSENTFVYPNPANDKLNIRMTHFKGKSFVKIYNSRGETVKSETLNNDLTTISLSGLSAGLYLYKIIDLNGNVLDTGKFMKE